MTASAKPSYRWDPVVKLTHWSIVMLVLANALATEEGSRTHVWVGYALAAILALRLIWGLVGSHAARFSAFPPSLQRALRQLREFGSGKVSEYPSHNPLGALMVYAVWATLTAVIATGIAMERLPETSDGSLDRRALPAEHAFQEEKRVRLGEVASQDSEGGMLGEIHEGAVKLLYALIVLHLAVSSSRHAGAAGI